MATAMKKKKYCVLIANGDGTYTLFRLKRWLRQNPQYMPDDRDPNEWHTHQLVAHLRSLGFTVEETLLCISPPG